MAALNTNPVAAASTANTTPKQAMLRIAIAIGMLILVFG
jgi:hypothetical protein